MYRENFSIRIKEARIEAGYIQEQVAAETGISQQNLSKYENGKLEPDLEKLGKLAQFYNVSIDWLLGVSILPPVRPSKTSKKPS